AESRGTWGPASGAALEAPGRTAPRVRLGRPIGTRTHVQVPVYLHSAAPYHALDLQIGYDSTRLAPTTVKLRRSNDPGMLSYHAEAGLLYEAVGSGEPLTRSSRILLLLGFAGPASGGPRLRVLAAGGRGQPP